MDTTTQVQDQETVTYRILEDGELPLIKHYFDQLGWPMPDADKAKIMVAEAGNMPVGFCVVQFIAHTEPMWVHPSIRGSGVAEALIDNVVHYVEHDCNLTRYVCTVKAGSFAERLAAAHGMVPVHGHTVMVKSVVKEG